jgi:hypothetical protein
MIINTLIHKFSSIYSGFYKSIQVIIYKYNMCLKKY